MIIEDNIVLKIQCKIRKKSSTEGIEKIKYFHKTAEGQYAGADKFLGISVPQIRKEVNEFWDCIKLAEIEELLHSEYHEERLCALLLLVKKYDKELEKEDIINVYLNNTRHINGWDLVDLSAPKIIGKYVYETKNYEMLYNLAKSKDMWEQRIAIVSNWYLIQNNDFECMLKIADMNLHTNYDLIQKAVGWMLREIGKRDYELEYNFLVTRYKKMPRTMLRYSIEKFDKLIYKKFLKGEINNEL